MQPPRGPPRAASVFRGTSTWPGAGPGRGPQI